MSRAATVNKPGAEQRSLQSKLSLLVVALLSGVLVSSVLITGDSITVRDGETLPQVLLILLTVAIAAVTGWNVLPLDRSRKSAAALCLIGIGCLLVSSISASIRAEGRLAWNSFWHVIALLLFATTLTQATQRATFAKALLQLIVVCCVFQSVYALHQYFVSMPQARAEYLADPDAGLLKAGIEAPPGSEIRTQYENRLLGSFEPIGTFALTNSLATLLSGTIIALFICVGLFKLRPKPLALWTSRAVLLVMGMVWLLTKSRSGFLAIAIVATATIAWQQLRKKNSTSTPTATPATTWILIATIALVAIGGAIVALANDQLVFSEAPKSILYRLEYWQATSKMILDYPLTGVGLGNFQSYYPRYKLPTASEAIADPHNWLFDLAANGSIPLLVVAVAALVIVLRRGAIQARPGDAHQSHDEPITAVEANDRAWGIAFWVGAAVAFLLIACLQLLFGQLIDVDATGLGLLAGVSVAWGLRELPVSERALRRAALLATITVLICLLASGSWQASGIALPLAAWMAIGCPGETRIESFPWRSRSVSSLWGLALVLIALTAFVWQTWQPVQQSWALEQQAIASWQNGRPEDALKLIDQSIAADRLATSPRRVLVQLSMDLALTTARRGTAGEFHAAAAKVDEALQELIASSPVSNLTYSYAGECNLALAAACVTNSPELASARVKQAARFYEQAVERYPTSVVLLAQCAAVRGWLDLAERGSVSDAVRELVDKANTLSNVTPHANRKLASQLVFLPPPLADRFDAGAIVRTSSDSPWVKAEPLCVFLRKL